MNLRYEFARLGTEYFLRGIQDAYSTGKSITPPQYVIWDCTRRCNLKCLHCGATREHYSDELTTRQVKNILDELAALKIGMFAATGGEPLLRNDLINILTYAHKKRLKTGFATNGFLVDQNMAGRIRDAGTYSVQVSLDGSEQTHNRIRGNNMSYARAMNAIELLLKSNIPLISIATTISCVNISEIEVMKKTLLEAGVRLWRLTLVMPIGRARSHGIMPGSDQFVPLIKFVKANDSRKLHIYFGENLPFLGEWEKQVRQTPLICPIGFTACCIGVDGNIRGCPEQPDVKENREGSLLERSFASVWKTGFQRYRNREILESDQNCAACKSKYFCYGGCWVMRTEGQHCIYRLLSPSSNTYSLKT